MHHSNIVQANWNLFWLYILGKKNFFLLTPIPNKIKQLKGGITAKKMKSLKAYSHL